MDHDGDARAAAEARLELALRAYRLKDEPRQGWVLRGVDAPESVAAHAWGTALLCLLFAEDAGVEPGRALAIAVVHDLAEAATGDIANRAHPDDRALDAAAKARLEEAALGWLLGTAEPDRLRSLWLEYEHGLTAEARFVRDMNLLDMLLQAVVYQEQARYDPGRPLPSRGGYRHLDEFFVSAERRLQGALARRLFGPIERRYRRARDGGEA